MSSVEKVSTALLAKRITEVLHPTCDSQCTKQHRMCITSTSYPQLVLTLFRTSKMSLHQTASLLYKTHSRMSSRWRSTPSWSLPKQTPSGSLWLPLAEMSHGPLRHVLAPYSKSKKVTFPPVGKGFTLCGVILATLHLFCFL